jgi:glycerophosphoryl diester phosphodiesterase
MQLYMMVQKIITGFLTLFICCSAVQNLAAQKHAYHIKDAAALQSFFAYRGDSTRIISGHRGSHISGYPENAIETFAYVLEHVPAFFEVDPRLTKDSVIVLLHDATLDRTTNGSGYLKDYTWEEVKKLRLKDAEGRLTDFRIPTLQEAIDWARGKTILNLDKKDVPMQMTADIIRRNKADAFVMVTVHNASQALFYYRDNSERMMSVHVRSDSALRVYDGTGIPWRNCIAYIGPEFTPANEKLLQQLHQRGVSCMLSAAPIYDKLRDRTDRWKAWQKVFQDGADILETDYPVELAQAVEHTERIRRPNP